MSERVPEGWAISNLDDAIDILSGFPFKSSEFTNDPSNFGLIRIRNLLGQELETFYSGEYSDDFVVQVGDILIGMDGDFHIVKWKSKNALLNQRICKLVPKQGGFDINFVHYFLIPELQKIHNQTTATTVKHLSVKDIREVEQAFPPLPEQKKIASILTSVDEVIETTQKQIDKLQDLKKATMNELLTKGIGHTEFKDSELGRIPKSWEVKLITTFIDDIVSGWSPTCEATKRVSNEWAILKTTAVIWDGYNPEENKALPKNLEPSHNAAINQGDVLVTRKGPRDRVGVCAYVDQKPINLMIPDTVFRLKIAPKMHPHFASLVISSQQVQGDWDRKKVGLAEAQVNINHQIINKTKIIVPDYDEQTKIVEIKENLQKRILIQRSKLAHTQSLKKSLMQDLLTGKVRVQVH